MIKPLFRLQTGATLIEVMVAIAISGILLPALATALVTAHASRPASQQQLQATNLMREADEAIRSLREASWDNVSSDGTFHPVISGTGWTLVSGSETIDGYTRQIVIGAVNRDSSGAVVTTGGTADPSTRSVVVTVSWSTPTPASVRSSTYLTRWQQNTVVAQTSQTDFTAGTLTDTAVTNTGGGEVQLDSNGTGGFQAGGSFESSSIDAGNAVGWQAIDFTASVPGDSTFKLQVATNTDNATWNYVGPDGTSGTYFTSRSAIPLSGAEGRYIRYKAYLTATSDTLQTPVLSDVTLDYSR